MAIFDYSGINWDTVTADQLIEIMRSANQSGNYFDDNFYDLAVRKLSVNVPSDVTAIFYAGANPIETGDAQAWQVAQDLSEQNSEEFRRLGHVDKWRAQSRIEVMSTKPR